MKKYNHEIIQVFLAVALALLAIGMYGDAMLMKTSTLSIIALTVASFYLSWASSFYIGNEKMRLHLAIATSYAFFSMVLLGGAIFILNFVMEIPNTSFALFGTAFIGLIVGRMYIAKELKTSTKQ